MGKIVENYEKREEQIKMMETVARSFNNGALAIVEAGTGTGKTLAYLIPAIAWALSNKERVVIATHTINLQEQLLGKDTPIAAQLFNAPVEAVIVKGRSQYVCKRKAMMLRSDENLLLEDEDTAALKNLVNWATHITTTGDRQELTQWPKDSLWEKVASGRDSCLHSSCPYAKECFVTLARRKADTANLIITNHALLFSDLALRSEGSSTGVLPTSYTVILDEAHNLEQAATDHFGIYFSRLEVLRALGGIYAERGHNQSGALFTFLRQVEKYKDELGKSLYDDILSAAKEIINDGFPQLKEALDDEFSELYDLLSKMDAQYKLTHGEKETLLPYRLTDERRNGETWEKIADCLKNIGSHLMRGEDIFKKFYKVVGDDFPEVLHGPIEDLKVRVNELSILSSGLDVIRKTPDSESGHVSWIDVGMQKNGQPKVDVQSLPVSVGRSLIENLYKRFRTVILTSATLSSGGSFDFFASRVGVDEYIEEQPRRPIYKEVYPSSFDYPRKTMLLLPTDIGSYAIDGAPGVKMNDALKRILALTEGSAFVLFTSYAAMLGAYRDLESPLRRLGMDPMMQGDGKLSRQQLLQKFRGAKNGVLFGMDSFWAGVDVAGEKLSSVIITSLPFPVPTEPIQEARCEALESRGVKAFPHYSLPQAVIKLRQGFGRLIRNRTDYGIVSILDTRILTKSYGKTFLKSLPESKRALGYLWEILPQAKAFLENCRKEIKNKANN